jgi:signal peptidase I
MNPALVQRAKKELKELTYLFVVIMVIRTFLYQPFNIPSGSMIPTLLVGDFLLVNKFCYGYGNESFPLRFKILSTRLFHKNPERGDIVVFNNPNHEHLDYIKRLVGLPGDRIHVRGGVLHINGTPVKLERIENFNNYNTERDRLDIVPQYLETLPNGVTHPILKQIPFGQARYDNTEELTVPADHFFMMGDNRDNSEDSRSPRQVGFIHKDLLMGKAVIIFFSTQAKWYEVHKWLFGMRPERILKVLR